MIVTVFSKTVTAKNGNQFERYITKLTDIQGQEHTMSVKFRKECGVPERCPCNIIVEKTDCNITKKKYHKNDTGEVFEAEELWVCKWTPGPEYIDHSTDNFNFD